MKPLHMHFGKKPDKAPRVSSMYMRLRSRFTVYFFLLVLLPYILFAVAAYFQTRSIVEENAFNLASASIEQEKAAIERYVRDLKLAANASAVSLAAAIQDGRNGTGIRAALSATLKNSIEENMTFVQLHTLSAAYVITQDGIKASYGADADTAAINSPASQQWFHNAVMKPDAVQILGTIQRFYAGGENKVVFCMAQAIPGSRGTEAQSVLLFDFSYDLFTDAVDIAPAEGIATERLIVDFEGNILYSRDQGKLTTAVDETIKEDIGSTGNGFKRISLGGNSCYMTYFRYPSLSWVFIDLNPASNVSERLWMRSPFMVACIIALPVILFIYLAILFRLVKPFNELTTVISDYEGQLPGVSGQVPLIREKLSGTGVHGISDIDYLINKIYTIKLRQKEAELNSLQNQINPHFLYNTLESIRGAALYHGIHDIAAMSKALSLLFRYSISDRVLVTIKEELQHLENYMSIQNFRFENKFELVYSVSPELMNYKILKLTLQPLIENSIKHGLEMKLGKGVVKIEILGLDNTIKIQISDDGLGIPPKKVEELNRSLVYDKYLSGSETDRTGTGIGVKNVNSRIKLYFGDQYGLKFRDALVGTTVEITLPAVMDKDN
jgi:two-component system sensor histidine kinase YesM